MKQTARIISTYSADVFGACSALFELGGMVIMHDASGCNSTYTTHDEPRWYDSDSMVYISALSETEAVMGDDEKLIGDIVSAAKELQPKFIAIAGTPIPAMTGFDFGAVARVIEKRSGIPCIGLPTTGMSTYISGVDMALAALARRFVREGCTKTERPSVNILGLTPLDFSTNGEDSSVARALEEAGFEICSRWAMGADMDEIAAAGGAHASLVVSAGGLSAARILWERFGIPYVAGVPMGRFSETIAEALRQAYRDGQNAAPFSNLPDGDIAIIGEGLQSLSLASAIELEAGRGARVLCATDCPARLLRKKDRLTPDEDDIAAALKAARVIIADPLYRPICPEAAQFISLPSEAFSGRIFRAEIPDLVSDFHTFFNKTKGAV